MSSSKQLRSGVPLLLGVGLALILGCDEPPSRPLPSASFLDVASRVDSVVLKTPPDRPIVVVSSLDVTPNGDLLIADASDARIWVFRPDGEPTASFGTRGEGPGEFFRPTVARWGPAGRIHVSDIQQGRVSVFSPKGQYEGGFRTPTDLAVQDMEVLPEGYLFSGLPNTTTDDVIRITDTLGTVLSSRLALANSRPPGTPPSPFWASLRFTAVAVDQERAFVTTSLLDSLWTLDLSSGEVVSEQVRIPGYMPPSVPETPPVEREDMLGWIQSQTVLATVAGDDDLLVVPFSRGLYYRQDQTSAAVRLPDGGWWAMDSVPVVMRARGGHLWAVDQTALNRHTTIYRYRVRGRR